MNKELLQHLITCGYADDAGIAAECRGADGRPYLLCVNGEIVTLVHGEHMELVFSDSIDKLKGIKVSGLFGKKVSFTHNGHDYALAVKGVKTLVEYFKLIV